ncbi:Zinc finger protein [Plakobranchus ocellatus]|uniref:Zinc finger protein n=1 Tax=Plakobranchus ocellatus TaxID=259542 RepID=A0AAV4AX60_9GAST|nr:Zinc finger protein [Plakobranchus ocellatus]
MAPWARCCIIGCQASSHKTDGTKIKSAPRFFVIPKVRKNAGDQTKELTTRRRLAWISAIRRPDVTFDRVSTGLRVCSNHFHKGAPAYERMESDPDWVPSLNLGHGEVKPASANRHSRRQRRSALPAPELCEDRDETSKRATASYGSSYKRSQQSDEKLTGSEQKKRRKASKSTDFTSVSMAGMAGQERTLNLYLQTELQMHCQDLDENITMQLNCDSDTDDSMDASGNTDDSIDTSSYPISEYSWNLVKPEPKLPSENVNQNCNTSSAHPVQLFSKADLMALQSKQTENSCSTTTIKPCSRVSVCDSADKLLADNRTQQSQDSSTLTRPFIQFTSEVTHSIDQEFSVAEQNKFSNASSIQPMHDEAGQEFACEEMCSVSELVAFATSAQPFFGLPESSKSNTGISSLLPPTHLNHATERLSVANSSQEKTKPSSVVQGKDTQLGKRKKKIGFVAPQATMLEVNKQIKLSGKRRRPVVLLIPPELISSIQNGKNVQKNKAHHQGLTKKSEAPIFGCKNKKNEFLPYGFCDRNIAPVIFSCEVCGKRFERVQLLEEHRIIHRPIINCYKCGVNFLDVRSAIRHKSTHFTLPRKYMCHICKENFRTYFCLMSHYKVHSEGESHLCQICGKVFKSRLHLSNHIFVQHEGGSLAKSYMCEECGKVLKSRNKFRIHLLNHKGIKLYTCRYCGKQLSTPSGFQGHLLAHQGPPQFKCDLCDKAYYIKTNLKNHRKDKHGVALR